MTSEELYNSFKWKEFVVGDLFIVEKGQTLTKESQVFGNLPFITASSSNNGVTSYIGNVIKTWENKITVCYDGEPGISFYHPYEFSANDRMCVLSLKNKILNLNLGVFFCTCLEKLKEKYSYGKKLGKERLTNEKIQLPVNKSGDLDFEAMEEYMILLDSEIIPEIGVPDLGKEEALLDSVAWDEFVVGDIFNIVRGKTLTKTNIVEGELPFVTASSLNNGISSYIGNEMKVWNNAITVCSNGEPGVSFYHNYDFTASGDVCVLTNKNLNDKVGVFLCACLEKLKPNYSYGKKLGIARLKEEIIHLPITDEGEINFKFMEEFMQSVSFYDIIKE